MASNSDMIVLAVGLVLAAVYLFRDQLFASKPKSTPVALPKASNAGGGDPRDFVEKMKAGKKRIVIFYGSQTGTAEEYAIRLAKEAKQKFGLASLVCDPEEYDFEKLDQIPEDCCVFFVMATYGEGEPTDNAVTLCQNLSEESFEFSNGEHKLPGLKYVIFGLGNKTYEHYNLIAKNVDRDLQKMGGVRIGERGEGDDDKSMEEDYLEWKDGMWEAFAQAMSVEEGQGGDTPDFAVTEVEDHPPEKVYLGELSARALTRSKGIHDAKNPYPAPITVARELFQQPSERNCVHMEFNTEGSGITYQHGDHVGVWPSNAEKEVFRLLCALGLYEKKDKVINIESLDPALAKVPFPVPTTYITVLRHYIDISAVAGRQILGVLSKFAPNPEAEAFLKTLNTNKDEYNTVVANGCLKLGEILQLAAGNDIHAEPSPENITPWTIPFDIVVSSIPRLQPRYYSIPRVLTMHDIFKLFKKDKEDGQTTHGHLGDVLVDKLVQEIGGLTLKQDAKTPPANSKPQTNEFIGGFFGSQGAPNRDDRHDRPSQDVYPQTLPQWQPARYPVPGPLPTPPAMLMPEPQVAGRPTQSLTSQYAQGIWNAGLGNPQLNAAGPPTPYLPPRPNSDPSVPQASDSISGRRPGPPSTPKRGSANPPQAPSTLPKPARASGSQFSPVGTPTKPARKRSSSTSALPLSAVTLTPSGTFQCSGLTQAGQRCKKMVKVNPTLTSVLGDDEDEDGGIQVYCAQHKEKVLDKKEFLSPVTGEYVKFSEFIPEYLDPTTQAALRVLMTKMASKADRDGYIYGFEILDPDNDEDVFFKVGRTVKLNKRMDEWANQCGSKSQHLRGRWPEMPGDDAPDLMGRLQQGRKGKFCFRLERLIHVELADVALNGQYLMSGFPTVCPDFSDNGSPKAKARAKCVDCGKMHKEIFTFKRAKKGRFHKHEWDLLVKPIIHRWGRFVEEHVIQETED